MTTPSPEWADGYTTGFADAAKRDPDYDAQQWALWQIRAEKAEAKLDRLSLVTPDLMASTDEYVLFARIAREVLGGEQ